MSDERFLGEPLPEYQCRNATVTDGADPCCLCGEALGHGPIAEQRFETDPTGTPYRAHESCARAYNMALRAFRSASGLESPQY
jgi:hypothetical protein